MDEVYVKLKKIDGKMEWPVRILFTVANIYTLLRQQACEEHFYPEMPITLTIIALWLYFFKLRSVAVLILLYQILIAWAHAR